MITLKEICPILFKKGVLEEKISKLSEELSEVSRKIFEKYILLEEEFKQYKNLRKYEPIERIFEYKIKRFRKEKINQDLIPRITSISNFLETTGLFEETNPLNKIYLKNNSYFAKNTYF